jgi:hypothetical protein
MTQLGSFTAGCKAASIFPAFNRKADGSAPVTIGAVPYKTCPSYTGSSISEANMLVVSAHGVLSVLCALCGEFRRSCTTESTESTEKIRTEPGVIARAAKQR